MYICICRAINERKIKETLDAGASSWQEISNILGAGQDCGKCCSSLAEIVEKKKKPSIYRP